ncbi:MAG: hypothetical protein AAF152_15855 [Cyanobacteria bacterium P01_A01_bin.114]
MVSCARVSLFHLAAVGGVSVLMLAATPFRASAQTATDAAAETLPAETPTTEIPATEIPAAEPATEPAAEPASALANTNGARLMAEAETAISAQDYSQAIDKLQAARDYLNQLSNNYSQLAAEFTGIDVNITDSMRSRALESAQMRDQATFRQALVYRAQNQPELAVPLLVEIVQSQDPGRDLGQRAYRQLFELGFVEFPYPRGSDADDSSGSNALRPLSPETNPTGIAAAEVLIQEAEQANAAGDYDRAAERLQTARDSLNQVSSYYQQLAGVFTGIDNRVASSVRERAVEAAQLRDQATLRQAQVYQAQNQGDLAVPLLVEVIDSQNPTRDLGQQAYQHLLEIGFVEFPFPSETPEDQAE